MRGGDATRLADLYQHEPLRVLFPDPLGDPMPAAVLANTAGGLVGGDRIAVEVEVGPGAALRVATQAAEKVYRSAGPEVTVANRLRVDAGGWCEWLPNETILYDRARLRRTLDLDLAPDAACLAAEMLVFGRIARGETVTAGALRDLWRVRRAGRLIWADALRLDGAIAATLDRPACFGGARALATILCAVPDAPARLAAIRDLLGEGPLAASAVGGLVAIRGLAPDPAVLRAAVLAAVPRLRALLGGWPATAPVTWTV